MRPTCSQGGKLREKLSKTIGTVGAAKGKVPVQSAIAYASYGGGTAIAADGARTPIGGPIKFFVTTFSNGTGDIIVTGAIGSYGTSAASGNDLKVTLQHGAFELNVATLVAKASKSGPSLNTVTCSGVSSVSAPAPVLNGSGAYRGLSGKLKVTETIAFILPHYASGAHKNECNNNTRPLDDYSSITGSGTVKFAYK